MAWYSDEKALWLLAKAYTLVPLQCPTGLVDGASSRRRNAADEHHTYPIPGTRLWQRWVRSLSDWLSSVSLRPFAAAWDILRLPPTC